MEHVKDGLAASLQPHVDAGTFAGAVVAVADREKILAVETVGFADLGTKAPMRPDTFFWIASMTKPVAAAAFMVLVDEGRASVEDRVDKYIPGFADLKVLRADGSLEPLRRPILVRDVLSHTSGLRFLNTQDKQVIDSVPLRTSIEHNLLEPLLSQPGTTYSYSNEGIDTAGRIIEIVTGQSFEAFVQERFLTPLGMTDTTFFPDASQLRRLAKIYRRREDGTGLEEMERISQMTYPLDGPGRHAAPGGGLFSSVRDVVRFCQMLLNGGTFEGRTYLSPASVRQMTVKQTGAEVAENYGFGCSASDGKTYGHGGALKTGMNIDHEQIRVFLTHYAGALDPDPAAVFAEAARRLYPGAGAVAVKMEGTSSLRR